MPRRHILGWDVLNELCHRQSCTGLFPTKWNKPPIERNWVTKSRKEHGARGSFFFFFFFCKRVLTVSQHLDPTLPEALLHSGSAHRRTWLVPTWGAGSGDAWGKTWKMRDTERERNPETWKIRAAQPGSASGVGGWAEFEREGRLGRQDQIRKNQNL